MSLLTANSIPVADAYISIPRVGRGVADLLLERDTGPSAGESVTLEWQDGEQLTMTCVFGQRARGWWRIRCVMGAGRMAKNLPGRYYEDIPTATVARDLLTEAGEAIESVDLPGILTRYVRRAAPAHEQLVALLADTGRIWRVMPNGKVWIGVDEFPSQGPLEVVRAYPEAQRYTLNLTPKLLPGVSLTGYIDGEERDLGRVERVVHRVEQHLHTEVWCAN